MTSGVTSLEPQLDKFHKATEYLQAYYKYRKGMDQGFSYEAWSVELGYRSRSFLKMLVSGQRGLTEDFVENFSRHVKFTPSQSQYFSLIALYEQAVAEHEKTVYLDKIFEYSGRLQQLQLVENKDEFLLDVHLPKLLLLLGFHDIQKTPEYLAQITGTDQASIEERLYKLASLGLAVQNESQWEAIEESFRVPSQFGSQALESYHNASLAEAMEAQKMEARLRRFRSLLLPLSEPEFEVLLGDIENLVGKAIAKHSHKHLLNRRLYKLNLNLYPVTELVHESENATGLSLKFENKDT